MHIAGAGRHQAPNDNIFLSPRKWSKRPPTAASANTRVVSWKEAAEINELVAKDAFVMPSKIGLC